MQAHLKPISIFPIHGQWILSGAAAQGSEAPPVANQVRSDVPGASLARNKKTPPPLEPSSAPQDAAKHLQRPVYVVVSPGGKAA